MGRVRLILISFTALVIALGAAFVARGLATPRQPKPVIVPVAAPAPPPKPTLNVLTAKHDLQVGDRLDAANIGWQPWPAEGVSATFITDGGSAATAPVSLPGKAMAVAGGAAQVAKSAVGVNDPGRMAGWFGAVVRQPIAAGEPVTEKKVVRAGASGVLAVTLQPGMRALSLPLTADSGAGGFILPGDHVDVVQIQKSPAGVQAATVMRNVRVLAIDQSTRADVKVTAQTGSQATIELSPAQAEDMVLARAQGDLTLVLRSYADAAGATSTGDIRRTPPGGAMVRVFRSGQESEVKVAR